MSVVAVILDAANIAAINRRNSEPPQWRFARVERVREACQETWPGAHVKAVIDASTEPRLVDQKRVEDAHAEGWLETAAGDADDRMLDMAAQFGAPVVSRDNFSDARRSHPWLEEEGRVWSFSVQKDRSIILKPRRLLPLTNEQVDEARRRKARKAGLASVGDDEVWVCTAPSERECEKAGQVVPGHQLIEVRGSRVHGRCSYPAREQVYTPATETLLLILSVDGRERRRLTVPVEGLMLGRGSPKRPDVTDVAATLDPVAAGRISRRHLHIVPDDDGWPVAVQQNSVSVTFLNPQIGRDGLPLDNGLREGEAYPLIEGDTLWLDDGRVKLTVAVEEPQ